MAESNAAPVFIAGSTGYVDGTLFSPGLLLQDVARQTDGKIIALGNARIYRFHADGSPDTTLDFDGSLTLRFGPNGAIAYTNLTNITPLPGGKMLITGSAKADLKTFEDSLLIARLNADGSLDTTFHNGGKVLNNPSTNAFETVVGTRILDDGKILVVAGGSDIVGNGTNIHEPQHITLARYLPDGAPDTGFGVNGILVTGNRHAQPGGMAVQADGKILVVATDHSSNPGYSQFMLFRYNADGTPDTNFGAGGALTTIFASMTYNRSGRGLQVALQPDGKIVAVGSAPPQTYDERLQSSFAVVRYNADGSLDTTFSGDGMFREFVGADHGTWRPQGDGAWTFGLANALHIADDGSILVAGMTHKGMVAVSESETQFAMIRLRPNGDIDTTFGTNGYVTSSAPPGTPSTSVGFENMVVGPDGKIVIAGAQHGPATGYGIYMVGFNADGSIDNSFGQRASGAQNNAIYLAGHPDQFLNAAIQIDDANVDDLNGGTYAGAHVTLVRWTGANAADNFVAGGALRFEKGRAVLDGVDIGAVEANAGTLRITFNDKATQARVNQALQSIAYENKEAGLVRQQINIDWTFSDGIAAARFTTTVAVQPAQPGQVPYWIDGLLARRTADQTADQLGTLLRSYLGDGENLAVKFDTTGSGVFSTSQRQLIERVLDDVESTIGVNFGTTGTQLAIKNSTELEAGKGAATPLTQGGADAYVGLMEDSATFANSGAVLHALSHALGLKDGDLPSVSGSILPLQDRDGQITVMQGGASTGVSGTYQHFGPLDIAALQFLYGPNTSSRAGDDVYRLSDKTSNFIWDGAGVDTISGEGLTANLTLHLEPGHWDYIGTQQRVITAAGQVTVNFGSVIENAIGGSGNDHISGTALANTLTGGAGNDRLEGLGGNDKLDGGTGIDTAVFNGARSAYTLKPDGTGFTATDRIGPGGTDTLVNVERIQFKDGMVAIDIDGSAGHLYRLYKAVFGRAPDPAGFGFWLAAMDNGMSAENIARQFMNSEEFAVQYGANPDSTKLLTTLYKNVLHREPDASGFAWWLNLLEKGTITASDALLGFSESTENRAQVIGEIENGILFAPFY